MRQVQEMTVKTVPTNTWTNNKSNHPQQQHQQQQQQMPSYNNQQHQMFYQQQNNHPVQSQNSAFANWTPSHVNNYYRPPFSPQHAPQNVFMPNFAHRMPIGSPQQSGPRMGPNMPPQRPLGASQPYASNEFLEFFKDLQKTQTKGKVAGPVNTNLLAGQPLQKVAQYNTNTSQKSPVKGSKKDTTDETETLKKLLNIAGKSSPSNSTPGDNKMTQQISVQDLFTHARNKEQKLVQQCPVKLPGFSVQLLNYCQGQHIGVPRYVYYPGQNGKIRAQVALLDGRKTVGEEANNKEEAAEFAAKALMGQIMQMNSPLKGKSQNRPNDTKSFPVPPKQWYQGPKGNQNQPGANVPEDTVNKSNGSSQPQNKSPPKDAAKSTPFVPLQAVKQQRTKSTSNDSNSSQEKCEHPSSSKKLENNENSKNKSNTNSVSSSDGHQSQSTSNTAPKQRRRRCRIAANFSGLEQKK